MDRLLGYQSSTHAGSVQLKGERPTMEKNIKAEEKNRIKTQGD
jgi:hypothetical protein